MMALLMRLIAITFVSFSLIVFSGCGDSGAESDLPLQDNTGDDTADDGDTSASLSNNFFVTFDSYDEDFYVTTNGTFNADCSISASTSSNEDLDCIFDVLELDAYVQTMDLQYNVPAGMLSLIHI